MDKSDQVLWHLILGTRGGPTRLQMIKTLNERPYNANQLAGVLNLDYKTIRHHLEILIKNSLITISREKQYGELYHLTEYAKSKMDLFKQIENLGKD